MKHYSNLENPSRCFVRLYKLYMSKLAPECSQCAFYFKPLQKWSTCTSGPWLSKQSLGHNTLSKMMAGMCERAGIDGFKTNHSLRAAAASQLYHNGVDEQLIMERTGHRSIEDIRSYKRTSEE